MKFSEYLIFESLRTKDDIEKAVNSFNSLPTSKQPIKAREIINAAEKVGYILKSQNILKFKVSPVETKFNNQEKLKEVIEKLENYSVSYKQDNNVKFSKACLDIVDLIKQEKLDEAVELFRLSELMYDIGNTYDKLRQIKKDLYVEKNFGTEWGIKPGEYVAYRSGDVENTKNGIFFSIDKKGAEAYSNNIRSTHKYKIKISSPLVADSVVDAYQKLTGKRFSTMEVKSDDWQLQLDIKVATLAKKSGYDSLVYIKPMPPAFREMVIFDKSKVEKAE
jgi:hypothetical protein